MFMKETFHTETITKEKIWELTRKVLTIDIPTGIGFGNFVRYEMRRHRIDDSGILLKCKLLKNLSFSRQQYEIADRYLRGDEWETIEFLLLESFKNLGVRNPELMWADDKDKYFQDRIREIDKEALITLKDDLASDTSLGSLFG